MKALSIVIVAVIGMVGCGSSSSNCPEGQIENDQGICVDVPECWGDNDCPTQHACIDFKCVLLQACEQDSDCSENGSLICNEEQMCISFLAGDVCYEKSCTEACNECGQYTVCYNGSCNSACSAYHNLKVLEGKNYCESHPEWQDCIPCICFSQWMEERNGECVPVGTNCNPDAAEAEKVLISSGEFKTEVRELIDVKCSGY